MDPATLTALDAMLVGDALGDLPADVQATVLALTVGTGLWAAARPRPAAVVAFVACSLLWSRANHAFEGRVLWTFSHGHGLTVADLLPPALTALILRRARRTASRPSRSSRPERLSRSSRPATHAARPA